MLVSLHSNHLTIFPEPLRVQNSVSTTKRLFCPPEIHFVGILSLRVQHLMVSFLNEIYSSWNHRLVSAFGGQPCSANGSLMTSKPVWRPRALRRRTAWLHSCARVSHLPVHLGYRLLCEPLLRCAVHGAAFSSPSTAHQGYQGLQGRCPESSEAIPRCFSRHSIQNPGC